MLLPDNVHPELTLYYNGAVLLGELKKCKRQSIVDLYQNVKLKNNMSFSTFILCLDWLYLIDSVKVIERGDVEICLLKD